MAKEKLKKIAICPTCHTKITVEGKLGEKVVVTCPTCGRKGRISFSSEFEELDFYPVNEPFAYVKILKDLKTLDKYYKLLEPPLSKEEAEALRFIYDTLLHTLNVGLEELKENEVGEFLKKEVDKIIKDYELSVSEQSKKKILYYLERDTVGFGKIDALMRDPNIEDISCDGSEVPIFLYHRKYGSLRTNIRFKDEEELSGFVIKLAQKCGKHISIAEPMLDATLPDGSRVQMTLSTEVTTRGSTFTIRKFRADPFTPPDLIELGTMSPEMVAYFWLIVEHGISAIFAGGTASGKTTTLNAVALFIPREAKIVSIEETRELNLPHPNWIPGVTRTGFGEVVADKIIGEIDMYDLLKAALRQRPEYIIVGEIRGREAYVLFQAMATGHTTYSTMHADSPHSLIHRLEGKPINIPRVMLQALEVVALQTTARVRGKRVRRCKQIVEIVDIDPKTREILTNEVFRWDPVEDTFIYSGRSYVLEKIRAGTGMSKEEMVEEIKRRVKILEWMRKKGLRSYKEVAKIVAEYAENPKSVMKRIEEKRIEEEEGSKKNAPK
ncbi:MAG TPA: secretion system protein E [Thermoplasmatales archaeon]|nr:secretion system protein E [Thermoplasmatales archaeon]